VVDQKGQNSIVVTPGANGLARAPERLSPALGSPVVALAQLEIPPGEIIKLFRLVKADGGITILNPSPFQFLPKELLELTSILILNEHEFAQLAGKPAANNPEAVMQSVVSADLPAPCCVVTLGGEGFILARQGLAPARFPGHQVTVVDTTGAGDCFAGWLAAELALDRPLEEAAKRANAAAALSVGRPGAGSSMPTRAEVDVFLQG